MSVTVQQGYTASSSSGGLTLGTAQNTTSGTAINFTGLPATVNLIFVMLSGVGNNSVGNLFVQIGDSGGTQVAASLARPRSVTTPSGRTYTAQVN